MLFSYKITNNKGKIKKGTLEAADIKKARDHLMLLDGTIVSLRPYKKKQSRFSVDISFGHISLLEKVMFAKHLSVMIKAGMPIDDALEVLASSGSDTMKKKLKEILIEVRKGNSLADTLRKYPKDFDSLFTNMIHVGETAGNLVANLELLAVQQRKNYELRSKIKAASVYPIIILVAIIGLIVVMSLFVLPKITDFFGTLQMELPLPTRILMGTSGFFINYWWAVILGIFVVMLVLQIMLRFKKTRLSLHRLLLKIPIFGNISRNINLAIFCRTLASLLDSGITIDQSLKILSGTLTNEVYVREITILYHKVLKGNTLESAMRNPHLYPPIVSRMTKVGETSGNLTDVLSYLAEFYEAEVDSATKNLSTVLEPALLILIGLIVGFVAISIIGPIYDLTSKVSG